MTPEQTTARDLTNLARAVRQPGPARLSAEQIADELDRISAQLPHPDLALPAKGSGPVATEEELKTAAAKRDEEARGGAGSPSSHTSSGAAAGGQAVTHSDESLAATLDANAGDVIAAAASMTDVAELKALCKAEEHGRQRSTVIAALKDRIAELKSDPRGR